MPAGLQAGFARVCSVHLDLMDEWELKSLRLLQQPPSPRSPKFRSLACELVNLEGNAPWLCLLVLAQAAAGTVPSIGHFDTLGVDRGKFPGKKERMTGSLSGCGGGAVRVLGQAPSSGVQVASSSQGHSGQQLPSLVTRLCFQAAAPGKPQHRRFYYGF